MNKLTSLFFVAAMALGTASTGCVSRSLIKVSDHPSKPLTSLQLSETHSYLFWSTHEHIFYSCSDQGQNLSCKRLCGGDTDVVCP